MSDPGQRFDYDRAAEHYDRHRSWTDEIPRRILDWARPAPGDRILEIGCGTGNLCRQIERLIPCPVVALDMSRGMLRKAVPKLGRCGLVQADAMRGPFADGAFRLVVGAFMLHHIERHLDLLREVRRWLSASDGAGGAAFVTTSHEQIRAHPLNEFFPSFAAIDAARFPDLPRVDRDLRGAGFACVSAEPIAVRRSMDARQYLEKVRGKFISTLSLMDEREFAAGIERLEGAVNSGRPLDLTWHGVLILACP